MYTPVCFDGKCRVCGACEETDTCATPTFATPGALRVAVCDIGSKNTEANRVVVCRPVGFGAALKRRKISKLDMSDEATKRLARFIKTIAFLDTAPWANIVFDVNDRMLRALIATHLHLIVGKDLFKNCNRAKLLRLVDPTRSLDGFSNVVWVTNRQQGKTSTIAKFAAALLLSSPVGGDLICIYSVSLERSNELSKAARQYVQYAADSPAYTHHVKVVKNNNVNFVVENHYGAQNYCIARPKNVDSCRGDAPESCFFGKSRMWRKRAPCPLTTPLLWLLCAPLCRSSCVPTMGLSWQTCAACARCAIRTTAKW